LNKDITKGYIRALESQIKFLEDQLNDIFRRGCLSEDVKKILEEVKMDLHDLHAKVAKTRNLD